MQLSPASANPALHHSSMLCQVQQPQLWNPNHDALQTPAGWPSQLQFMSLADLSSNALQPPTPTKGGGWRHTSSHSLRPCIFQTGGGGLASSCRGGLPQAGRGGWGGLASPSRAVCKPRRGGLPALQRPQPGWPANSNSGLIYSIIVVCRATCCFLACRSLMHPSSRSTQWRTDTFRQSCPSPLQCRCMAASCSPLTRPAATTSRGPTNGGRGPAPSNPSAICLHSPGLVRQQLHPDRCCVGECFVVCAVWTGSCLLMGIGRGGGAGGKGAVEVETSRAVRRDKLTC